MCDLFSLTNLIRSELRHTRAGVSLIDSMLTNKTPLFQTTLATEIGLSDYHKLVATFFKSHLFHLRCKTINYKEIIELNISKLLHRSSHQRCSMKLGVLKSFAKFTGKNPYQSRFLKLRASCLQLYQKIDPDTVVFLWILCNFQKNRFYKTPPNYLFCM